MMFTRKAGMLRNPNPPKSPPPLAECGDGLAREKECLRIVRTQHNHAGIRYEKL